MAAVFIEILDPGVMSLDEVIVSRAASRCYSATRLPRRPNGPRILANPECRRRTAEDRARYRRNSMKLVRKSVTRGGPNPVRALAYGDPVGGVISISYEPPANPRNDTTPCASDVAVPASTPVVSVSPLI